LNNKTFEMAEKSILEQALLQVQTLEEAVKQNAKGILASTMKQELNDLLKESKEEEEIPEEETEDMSEQPEVDSEDDENDEDLDNEDSIDNEFSADDDSMDDESDSFGDDDSMDDDLDSFGDEDSMDDDLDSFGDEDSMDDDVMDMTNASDDEVLKVFKSMKPEDGIVVKKDGDNVEMDVDGDEYIIKLDDEDDEMEDDFSSDDFSSDEISEDDMEETIYEIELDEEDELEESDEETHMGKKIEATEAARTKSNPHGDKGPGQGRTGLKSKKMYKAGSGSLNEEIQTLKKQNSEYKKALVLFKEKLNEVAVFNANLAYATRLFTEHSTTKQEKLNILKRFDTVSTMNESKNLFSTIKGELENKKPITESVVNKITNTPTSSSSHEILSEAKAYENPQFKRMKELMGKIK